MNTNTDTPYITVYAESTPNPSTMKFVSSSLLVQNDDSYEFAPSSNAVQHSLFAKKLFEFPFIKGIFITSNFVSITKSDNIEWGSIVSSLREFIQSYLREGNEVIGPAIHNTTSSGSKIAYKTAQYSEKEKQIIAILEEYVRPAVEQDGGLISFQSYENGVIKVVLQGSCSGCPSSQMTLKSGIETLLKQMMPEVQSVEAVEA